MKRFLPHFFSGYFGKDQALILQEKRNAGSSGGSSTLCTQKSKDYGLTAFPITVADLFARVLCCLCSSTQQESEIRASSSSCKTAF